MWSYRCHSFLQRLLSPIERILKFLHRLSWTYAHYRNGSFPYQFPDRPRLRWKNQSFIECVKEAWQSSGLDE